MSDRYNPLWAHTQMQGQESHNDIVRVVKKVANTEKTGSQRNHPEVTTVVGHPKQETQEQLNLAASLLVKQPIRKLKKRHQAELRSDHHQKYPIISYHS